MAGPGVAIIGPSGRPMADPSINAPGTDPGPRTDAEWLATRELTEARLFAGQLPAVQTFPGIVAPDFQAIREGTPQFPGVPVTKEAQAGAGKVIKRVVDAEREFHRIANEVDKTAPHRGALEGERRHEQKVSAYDQSARTGASRRRRTTLSNSSRSGSGGAKGAVTGLSSSSFKKTLLGG